MSSLIIDFTSPAEAARGESLRKKLADSGETVNYIRVDKNNLKKLPQETLKFLKKIDDHCRIYIIEHGLPNQTTVGGIHYQELAALLANNIEDENIHKPNSQLRISLIPCFSGRGENSGLESFAGLFHRYLGKHYKIYSTVLARNELVWTRGPKYTATELDHAYMLAAERIGVSKEIIESRLRHQHPGTKILLRWDKNGDEWVVDAYIDKYFAQTAKIVSLLDQVIQKEDFDQATITSLEESKAKLIDLLSDPQNENFVCVKIMDNELKKIKSHIGHLNSVDGQSLIKIIDFNNNLSIASINKESINPVHSDANIETKLKVKEENVEEKVQEIALPINELVSHLPDTENGNNVKKSALELTGVLSKIASRKLKKEYEYKLERDISRFSENILYFLIDPDLSKTEKIGYIQQMNEEMIKEIAEIITVSPEITGAIEGVRAAKRIGGWMGIKNLSKLISLRAKEKGEQFAQLSKNIEAFVNACENYVNAQQ
jgi:hypothetical protein